MRFEMLKPNSDLNVFLPYFEASNKKILLRSVGHLKLNNAQLPLDFNI